MIILIIVSFVKNIKRSKWRIQKGIYLTLKQQLELANIEKIQKESIVQVLDEPQFPLVGSRKNLITKVILGGVFGLGFGILLGFIRSYLNNSNIDERRKLRRVRNFVKKKSYDFVSDYRVYGITSLMFLIGLPYSLSYKSSHPVYFDMYSSAAMLLNIIYIIALIISSILFIYYRRKNF